MPAPTLLFLLFRASRTFLATDFFFVRSSLRGKLRISQHIPKFLFAFLNFKISGFQSRRKREETDRDRDITAQRDERDREREREREKYRERERKTDGRTNVKQAKQIIVKQRKSENRRQDKIRSEDNGYLRVFAGSHRGGSTAGRSCAPYDEAEFNTEAGSDDEAGTGCR